MQKKPQVRVYVSFVGVYHHPWRFVAKCTSFALQPPITGDERRQIVASVKITRDLIRTVIPEAKPFDVRDSDVRGFILRVNPSGRMAFVVQYDRSKRLTLGYTDVLNVSEARDMARMVLADYARGIDPQEERRKAKQAARREAALTLGALLDGTEYTTWARSHYRDSEAVVKRLKVNFSDLLAMPVDQITPGIVRDWRQKRSASGMSASTLNRQLNPLKAVFRWAASDEATRHGALIERNPLVGAAKMEKVDSGDPVTRYLTSDEETRLRATLDAREARIRAERASANRWRAVRGYDLMPDLKDGYADRLKPLVLLSLNTGIRRGEAFALTWDRVNLLSATPIITIEGKSSKTNSTRHIPLNREALEVLTAWKKQQGGRGYVFPGDDGKQLQSVRSSWEQVLVDAKISDFRWHDLRHTFASNLAIAGESLYVIQQLLGHKTPKMTMRYAHLSPGVFSSAVARLDRRGA